MTPAPAEIPLTLTFTPEDSILDETTGESLEGIVIAQPSRKEEGMLYLGVNPFGKTVGCHLLPEEARRLRDHLNILLLEPSDATADLDAAVAEAKAAQPSESAWTPEQLLAYKQRRETPSRHIKLPKIPKPQFRLEFKWGSFEALIVRLSRRG